MNRRLLFYFIFLLTTLIAPAANAQTAVVSGKVMDVQKLSLPGATLKLTPGNRYTISDVYGQFEFLNVPAGNYKIEVTYMGYQPYQQDVDLTKRNVNLEIRMEEGGLDMAEAVVLGDRLKGQAKALNMQRNNENITNIISSD